MKAWLKRKKNILKFHVSFKTFSGCKLYQDTLSLHARGFKALSGLLAKDIKIRYSGVPIRRTVPIKSSGCTISVNILKCAGAGPPKKRPLLG